MHLKIHWINIQEQRRGIDEYNSIPIELSFGIIRNLFVLAETLQ